jgi:dihydroorotate dehydrogenase
VSLYTALARPLLFSLDAEFAHNLIVGALGSPMGRSALVGVGQAPGNDCLRQHVFGLTFENPVGLAAGLDKHGTAVPAWQRLGFGFAEVGTVTPRAQPGNPRPRLFRLAEDEALINRFGFNSVGATRVARSVVHDPAGPMRLGINLGKNKDTPNERAVDDYVAAVDALALVADYFVINVSSPNTSGLRDLQEAKRLRALVSDVVTRVHERSQGRAIPVLVKLSPDMPDAELLDAADASLEAGARGLIATNTTLGRRDLRSTEALTQQAGGLSGAPLRRRALHVCRTLFTHLAGRAPIVGVGGIDSAAAAYERIRAGATLVQLYTGLIYRGPSLVDDVVRGLTDHLQRDGFTHIREAIGIDAH